jgi:hypothetical protein
MAVAAASDLKSRSMVGAARPLPRSTNRKTAVKRAAASTRISVRMNARTRLMRTSGGLPDVVACPVASLADFRLCEAVPGHVKADRELR